MISLKQLYRMDAKALRRWKRAVRRRGFLLSDPEYSRYLDVRKQVMKREYDYVAAGKIVFVPMPF